MMIVVVIMRQGRTALEDMKAIMVMRMTVTPEALIIMIHAVDSDDIANALGRNEGYAVFFFLFLDFSRLEKMLSEAF